MAAKVITIAQQKGGAGKTTVVAQLAVLWAHEGQRVALVDIDPQASLTAWHMARRRSMRDQDAGGIHLSTVGGWRLAAELDRLRKDYDVVLVDSPPHADSDARVAIRAADLVVVPLQPSPMDLWAITPTLEIARKEKRPFLVILNRMPARGRLPDQVLAKLAEDQIPVSEASLGNRVPFAASMMEGLGVVEVANKSAAIDDLRAVGAAVLAAIPVGKTLR